MLRGVIKGRDNIDNSARCSKHSNMVMMLYEHADAMSENQDKIEYSNPSSYNT